MTENSKTMCRVGAPYFTFFHVAASLDTPKFRLNTSPAFRSSLPCTSMGWFWFVLSFWIYSLLFYHLTCRKYFRRYIHPQNLTMFFLLLFPFAAPLVRGYPRKPVSRLRREPPTLCHVPRHRNVIITVGTGLLFFGNIFISSARGQRRTTCCQVWFTCCVHATSPLVVPHLPAEGFRSALWATSSHIFSILSFGVGMPNLPLLAQAVQAYSG